MNLALSRGAGVGPIVVASIAIALGTATAIVVADPRVIASFLTPDDRLQKADAILVYSGDPGYERTLEAARLYHLGYARYLIFSGSGAGGDSAKSMAQVAELHDVPTRLILADERATNTYENVLFVRGIIARCRVHKLILVTSPYHQRRAFLVARHLLPGVTLINHPLQASANLPASWRNPTVRATVLLEYEKLVRYFAMGRI